MNKFFKMSLVAAAVAVSGTATAGQFDGATSTDAVVFSAEGAAVTSSTAQYAGAINYTLGASYAVGNDLNLTFSAGSINSNTVFPASVIVATTVHATTGTTSTFALNSSSGDTVSYRLISQATGVDTSASTLNLFAIAQGKSTLADLTDATKSGVVLNTSAVVAGDVTVTAASVASGIDFDADTTAKDANILAETTTQFGKYSVTASGFDAVIDTDSGSLGKVFKPAAADVLALTYANPTKVPAIAVAGVDDALNLLAATKLTTTISVKGNFAGFEAGQIVGAAGTTTLTATGFDVALAAGAAPLGETITITPDATKNDALVAQDFTASPSVAYASTSKDYSAILAGSWTVADETANVSYMPYADGISQIIYITNTDANDAEVSVVATDENGVKYALGNLVTAPGNGEITKITDEVKQALRAQGFTTGKVSLDFMFVGVTTTDAVKLYSAYNVGGTDRGFVTNTTNGAK